MGATTFFTTDQLKAGGHTTASIRRATEAGDLERVIRGWYAVRETDREAVRAMRLGGRLGCVSALRLHGAWTPPDQSMHLLYPTGASGRRLAVRGAPAGTVAHWHGKPDRTGSGFAVAPIELAAAHVLDCQPAHFAVAIFDSLLHRRRISRNRLSAVIAHGPVRMRYLDTMLNPLCEEGIESIARFRLAAAGVPGRVQVEIRRDRVDILVGDWLVIEADGRGTHAQVDAFVRDRRRVVRMLRNGRIVLQFAYATIMYDWDFVLESVLAAQAQFAPIA